MAEISTTAVSVLRYFRDTLRFLPRSVPVDQVRCELQAIELREGDVCIDCGANVGDITEDLSRQGARVYTFEPNPHAFALLARRFSGQKRVQCIQKGVYDRDGRMRLYLHESADRDQVKWSTGSSLLECKSNVDSGSYHVVDVIDLSAFIAALGRRVRVLKMDIEGVECRVVSKLIDEGTIDLVDHLYVETHDDKTPILKAETDALRVRIRKAGLTHINLDWG